MNSSGKITPLWGSQQGSALYLDPPPDRDPYATWRLELNSQPGLLPVRRIPPKRKSFSGYVPFPGLGRVVWYESLLEQRLLLALKHLTPHPEVLEQPLTLNMRALGFRGKHYTPDFLVWAHGIKPTLIEVKYEEDLRKNWERLKPKLMAARRYAQWRGWNFRLVTDRHLHPEGVQRIDPPLLGLVSPYRRVPMTPAALKPRPVIWGASPGHAVTQMDRTSLLIPPTARLLARILRSAPQRML